MIRKSQLLVRVTPEEKKAFKLAAKAERKTISDWIREKLLEKTAVDSLPAISRFDAAMGSLQLVRKEFDNWSNAKELGRAPCGQCGSAAHDMHDCPKVIETMWKSDQLPDTGKLMLLDGNSSPELVVCDRCHESGHKGEDCPIPMHLDAGKWVRD